MKKWLSSVIVCFALASCNTEGVGKHEGEYAPTPNVDSNKVQPEHEVEVDSLQMNMDSAFNFTVNKPVDSIKLKSGVQIKFLEHGKGDQVNKYDVVAINYRGSVKNGRMFESSEMFKKPVPFVVGIKMTFDAFDEVLQKCKVGDKIRFIIPAKEAYGEKGRGNVIPPNSDLVYEMDIIEKVRGKKTPSGVECFSLISNPAGVQPKEGDMISLGYMGWVKKTGKLFDASAANGKLYEFVLGTGTAIKAWHEAVATMRQGEKLLILAPAATAYGFKGVPELVPSGADLVYILELKGVESK